MKFFLIPTGHGSYEIAEAETREAALAWYGLHQGVSAVDVPNVKEITPVEAANHAAQGRPVRKASPRIVKQLYEILGVELKKVDSDPKPATV